MSGFCFLSMLMIPSSFYLFVLCFSRYRFFICLPVVTSFSLSRFSLISFLLFLTSLFLLLPPYLTGFSYSLRFSYVFISLAPWWSLASFVVHLALASLCSGWSFLLCFCLFLCFSTFPSPFRSLFAVPTRWVDSSSELFPRFSVPEGIVRKGKIRDGMTGIVGPASRKVAVVICAGSGGVDMTNGWWASTKSRWPYSGQQRTSICWAGLSLRYVSSVELCN